MTSNLFQINRVVSEHQYRLYELTSEGQDTWTCIAEEGEMRVYKRELEVDGVVVDPLKAVTTISVLASFIYLQGQVMVERLLLHIVWLSFIIRSYPLW